MTVPRSKLRQYFKQRRSEITPDSRLVANQAIIHHLTNYFDQRNRSNSTLTVAAFMATENEVDLRPWLKLHLARGGRAALPRIKTSGSMTFHQYDQTTGLELNRYGIAEPVYSSAIVAVNDIDFILVPLVAFDRVGTRLGMGGGYYDRYLVNLPADAVAVGIAFACQQSAEPLPHASWDIPLRTVVTENGMLELGETIP